MQVDGALDRPAVAEEPSGLEALVRVSEQALGRFLAQIMRDRFLAEDVLQETLLVAVERRAELASVENPRAWLFGVARNRALVALRGLRRARAALDRLGRGGGDTADPADAVAVRDLLVRVLSPDDRMLVVLRYVHSFSAADLATMTGRSEDAVRQRLSRARRRLLAAFENGDDHLPALPPSGGEPHGRDD
jgi:RNA polymerase sigma-70 factor, ECF subfamily